MGEEGVVQGEGSEQETLFEKTFDEDVNLMSPLNDVVYLNYFVLTVAKRGKHTVFDIGCRM